jgi:hypothetical protein
MVVSNRVGRAITIKGKQVYVRLNGNLDNIGVAENSTAPTLEGQIGVESSGVVIDVSDAKIKLNPTNADAGAGVVIFASFPLQPGRTKSRMAQIYSATDSTVTVDGNVWLGYIAHWGHTPAAGERIQVSAKYINNTTGEESPLAVFEDVIVVA